MKCLPLHALKNLISKQYFTYAIHLFYSEQIFRISYYPSISQIQALLFLSGNEPPVFFAQTLQDSHRLVIDIQKQSSDLQIPLVIAPYISSPYPHKKNHSFT